MGVLVSDSLFSYTSFIYRNKQFDRRCVINKFCYNQNTNGVGWLWYGCTMYYKFTIQYIMHVLSGHDTWFNMYRDNAFYIDFELTHNTSDLCQTWAIWCHNRWYKCGKDHLIVMIQFFVDIIVSARIHSNGQ